MHKRYVFIFLVLTFVVSLIVIMSKADRKQERQIPVVVSVEVKPDVVKTGEAIPLIITISNGLPSSIDLSGFTLTPNDWNGETCNVSLVDIYRDDKEGNLYLARPEINPPMTVSGMRRWEIKSGERLKIQTDACKWKLRDGWLPGRYRITARVDNLKVDEYSTLSVLTDPVQFEIN